jgi:tetratricopeptide (TPR) repeat protein
MFALTAPRRRSAPIDPPASARRSVPALSFAGRDALLDSAQAAALADPAFCALIAKGDALRDAGEWKPAAEAYGDALKLYPYEASYWTQLGHMLKEQGYFGLAEITYRTAAAFGTPAQDVRPHLLFAMERQGADPGRWPMRLREPGALHRQAPGQPDLLGLARLLWGAFDVADEEQLDLLRRCGTLDQLAAAMIADPRFEKANRVWLELLREDEL